MSQNIKRFWIWVGVILLIELAAFTLWKRWYWFFPSHSVSEVYTKYAGTDGINAAFVKDYRINDTVFVDVTLLEAADSNGWNILCEDFNIEKLDSVSQKKVFNGKDLIFTKRVNRNDYSQPIFDTSQNAALRVVSYLNKTVGIFHTKNKEEEHAVIYYNFDRTVYQKK